MLQWTWQILVNARMMKIIRKELKTQAGTTFSYFETIGKVRQVKMDMLTATVLEFTPALLNLNILTHC